jgi:hypothetical protein
MVVKRGIRAAKIARVAGAGLMVAALTAGLSVAQAQAASPQERAAADASGAVWRVDTPAVGDAPITVLEKVGSLGGTTIMVGSVRPAGTKKWVPTAAHWAGGRWVTDTVPVPGDAEHARLHSVRVTGPREAWAAGYLEGRPWVVRWDGATWSTVDTTALPGGELFAVSGTAGNLWAVGGAEDGSLVAHWNGTAWTRVVLPTHPDGTPWDIGWYSGVSALAPDDVWVVGPENTSAHWDGRAWTRVAVPRADDGSSIWLEQVRASPDQGTWAVGYVVGSPRLAVALRWTGRAWERVAVPAAGYQLDDVAFTAAGPIAVGAEYDPTAPIGESGYAVRLPTRAGQSATRVALPSGVEHLWGATTGEFGIGLRVIGTAQNPDGSRTVPFTARTSWVPLS